MKKVKMLGGDTTITLATLAAVLLFAHLSFSQFFPGPNGMGHDYSIALPMMLAEYYWSLNQGVLSTAWFTPAFCGGIPIFADPISMYFAFPSILVRALHIDPVQSAYLTFLLFIGIGFLGAYQYCRHSLALSLASTLLASTLFALNGFYLHRFIVGHIGFHGVALIPWLAYCVSPRSDDHPVSTAKSIALILMGSLVLTYWVHSGAQAAIPPFGFAAVALVLLSWSRRKHFTGDIQRSIVVASLALALSASKLVAMFSYLANFARSDYLLPGYSSLTDSVFIALLTVFANFTDIATISSQRLENVQWAIDRQELEYGLTIVPLIILVLAVLKKTLQRNHADLAEHSSDVNKVPPSYRLAAIYSALTGVLLIPIALNTYSPEWNLALKSLPIIGSSSSMIRWYVIYVPVIAVMAGVCLDYLCQTAKSKMIVAVVSATAFMLLTFSVDRGFYLSQNYDPKPVTDAFFARSTPNAVNPMIGAIGAYVDTQGNIVAPVNRNDLIVNGVSQLACYMPIFGYRLEAFPFKTLRLGATLEAIDGTLNVKDPSCFVFPTENYCQPGDHFKVDRIEDARQFLSYRAFDFNKSRGQKLADVVSMLAALLVGALMIALLIIVARTRLDQIRTKPPGP
jgi:hypothetical protein